MESSPPTLPAASSSANCSTTSSTDTGGPSADNPRWVSITVVQMHCCSLLFMLLRARTERSPLRYRPGSGSGRCAERRRVRAVHEFNVKNVDRHDLLLWWRGAAARVPTTACLLHAYAQSPLPARLRRSSPLQNPTHFRRRHPATTRRDSRAQRAKPESFYC